MYDFGSFLAHDLTATLRQQSGKQRLLPVVQFLIGCDCTVPATFRIFPAATSLLPSRSNSINGPLKLTDVHPCFAKGTADWRRSIFQKVESDLLDDADALLFSFERQTPFLADLDDACRRNAVCDPRWLSMTAPHLQRAIDRFVAIARESRERKRGGPFFHHPITDWAKLQELMQRGRAYTRALPGDSSIADPRATFSSLTIGRVSFAYLTSETRCEFETRFSFGQLAVHYIVEGELTYLAGDDVVATSQVSDFVFSIGRGPTIRTATTDKFAIVIVTLDVPTGRRRFSLPNEPIANQRLRLYEKNGVVVGKPSTMWALHLAYVLNYAIEAHSAGIDTSATVRLLEEHLYLHFCNELIAQSPGDDRKHHHTIVPLKLKMAESYVMANVMRAPTVEEVAAAAKLSLRSLHILSMKFRGMSPGMFIREQRLIGVRNALRGAARDATVTEIATAWAFNNTGRFAASYKQRFGELPSDTLSHMETRPTTGADDQS
jgi:AraC-like DNA-binding protein